MVLTCQDSNTGRNLQNIDETEGWGIKSTFTDSPADEKLEPNTADVSGKQIDLFVNWFQL